MVLMPGISGQGGTEAQKAAVQREEDSFAKRRGRTQGRQDGYCSYCSVKNDCLMACKSIDVPPHPSNSRSDNKNKSRAEDMQRRRKFKRLLDMARAEPTLSPQSSPV